MNLKEIREREQAATKGEWKMWDGYAHDGFHYTPRIGTNIQTVFSAGGKDIEGLKDDFEFVAHARQDIPDLLDALERHGGHTDDCASRNPYDSALPSTAPECDCGWAELEDAEGRGVDVLDKQGEG